jgi:predicted nuclease of predicted toxin-antitoxin system
MKFVVDAHLPPRLCAALNAAGHEAIHTSQLAARNQTPDKMISLLSLAELNRAAEQVVLGVT